MQKPTSFAIGIVAHQARSANAHQLMEDAGAVRMSMSNGTLTCNDNHKLVLKRLSKYDTAWTCVLEDDAQLCDNWAENLQQALSLAPGPVVSFYLGTNLPAWYQPKTSPNAVPLQPLIRKAIAKAGDACWITSPCLFHAVGYAIRTELIADLLATIDTNMSIDKAISNWAEANSHTVAYTNPSLVQHRDEPTLVKHRDGMPRTQPRVAHQHGAPTQWNATTVKLA